jgi:hypothetical protein
MPREFLSVLKKKLEDDGLFAQLTFEELNSSMTDRAEAD